MTFYVYEHVRRDNARVFYVGKGKGRRAIAKQGRNPYWHNVAAKAGFDVRYIARDLPEELAHLVEVERIDQLRRRGARLVNLTDGGDGMSGHVPTEATRAKRSASMQGVPKSPEHRAALSAACVGRPVSAEARVKISAAFKGRVGPMLGKTHRPESKQQIADAQRGNRNHFFGRTHTPESLVRMSQSHKGAKDSEETRAKKSLARLGALNPRFGAVISDEQKARQIAALKARPKVACPHCSKVVDEANAKRWHLDNCKEKA